MTEFGTEPRYLGKDFSEFLGAMRVISGVSQAGMAREFGVNQASVTHWMNGDATPSPKHDDKFRSILGLTQIEIDGLRAATKHARAERTTIKIDHSPQDRIIGAFAVRIQTGDPPLNATEADLLRHLLENSPEQ